MKLKIFSVFIGLYFYITLPCASSENTQSKNAADFGKLIVDKINNKDTSGLADLIDIKTFASRTAALCADPNSNKEAFISGFIKGQGGDGRKLAESMTGVRAANATVHAKYLKTVSGGPEIRPLLRIEAANSVTGGSFDYVEIITSVDIDGRYKLVDFVRYSFGGAVTEIVCDGVLRQTRDNSGIIDKWFGNTNHDSRIHDSILNIYKLANAGNFREALRESESIPPPIANTREIRMLKLGLARLVSEDALLEVQRELSECCMDDYLISLGLLDYFFKQRNFDQANKLLDILQHRVGIDGRILTQRGTINTASGKRTEAIANFKQAISLEPDLTDPYFALADLYVASNEFNEAIKIFDTIHLRFRTNVSQKLFLSNQQYNKFTQSKEFKEWLIN